MKFDDVATLVMRQAAEVMKDLFFFFNDTATTEISPLPLHDALPISSPAADGSGTIGAGTGLAARCDGGAAARGGSDGIVGWNWAPLARRGDGAAPVSSSVTDLMNSSSSTWAGFAGGSKGMRGRSGVTAGAAWRAGGAGAGAVAGLGAGRLRTSASSSSSFWISASTACRSSRTDTSSASTSWCTCSHCDSSYSPTEWRDRKSTRLNSSHSQISYAVFCLKKKKNIYDVEDNSSHRSTDHLSL